MATGLIPEIWPPGTLCTTGCHPSRRRGPRTPLSLSWKPALLARWAAANLSLFCFSETIRRASGLGAWVAKSFPLARPYHGLRSLPAKFSLELWLGGRAGGKESRRVGGGKRGGSGAANKATPLRAPGEPVGLCFPRAVGMMLPPPRACPPCQAHHIWDVPHNSSVTPTLQRGRPSLREGGTRPGCHRGEGCFL